MARGRERILTQEQQEEIIRNYHPKDSAAQIGRRYGVTHSSIIRILGDIYVPNKVFQKKRKTKPFETQPARENRMEEEAAKFKQYMEESFAKIQVGQEVHYKKTTATVIQKTDNLIVLKVHGKHFEDITSLNKADIAKGLIQNIA